VPTRSSLTTRFSVPMRVSILLALSLAVLSGCGRRGPLEPPPKALAPSENPLSGNPEENMQDPSLNSSSPNPTGRAARIIKAPKQPFILDPLL
jgi:predicted small lipoprotein YifL